jgi:hypothetical protein
VRQVSRAEALECGTRHHLEQRVARNASRDFRLTDVEGRVVEELFS